MTAIDREGSSGGQGSHDGSLSFVADTNLLSYLICEAGHQNSIYDLPFFLFFCLPGLWKCHSSTDMRDGTRLEPTK